MKFWITFVKDENKLILYVLFRSGITVHEKNAV